MIHKDVQFGVELHLKFVEHKQSSHSHKLVVSDDAECGITAAHEFSTELGSVVPGGFWIIQAKDLKSKGKPATAKLLIARMYIPLKDALIEATRASGAVEIDKGVVVQVEEGRVKFTVTVVDIRLYKNGLVEWADWHAKVELVGQTASAGGGE